MSRSVFPSAAIRPFAAILLLAAALRLPLAFVELFHHPDEVWQYLEPAYGMVTGRAVVTWEYRAAMRSWLVPSLLAAPIALGKAIAPDGPLYLRLARLLLVAGSLAIPGFAMAIAARRSRLHGLVAGLILATAFELVYFSARALSDTIAVALFLPAAWALLPDARPRRWLLGGLLLGLAVAVRFQLAPAVALFAALCCGRDRRGWARVAIGGLAGLAIDGLVDLAHGAVPFAWMANNLRLNLVVGRSAAYGVAPASYYVVEQARVWGWGTLPVVALALLGARRQPILLAVALANIGVHSLIPHKEYRFVWLSSVLVLLLAALGTGEAIAWARARWPARHRAIAAAAILLWLGCSAAAGTSAGGRGQWHGGGRSIALMRAEHDAPGGCGLAYYRPSEDQRAAYLYYDRPAPIAFLDQASAGDDLRRYADRFDLVVASPDDAAALGPAFRRRMCKYPLDAPRGSLPSQQVCLYVRPGPCRGALPARLDVNAGFARQRR